MISNISLRVFLSAAGDLNSDICNSTLLLSYPATILSSPPTLSFNVSYQKYDWRVAGSSVVERYMDKMSLFLLPDGSTPLFSFHHFIFIKLFFAFAMDEQSCILCYLHYLLLLQKLWSGNPQINQHKYSINLFRVHTAPQWNWPPPTQFAANARFSTICHYQFPHKMETGKLQSFEK